MTEEKQKTFCHKTPAKSAMQVEYPNNVYIDTRSNSKHASITFESLQSPIAHVRKQSN